MCKKLLSAVICLALVFGVFGTTAFAAAGGVRSVSFPEEFESLKMLCFNLDELNFDSGVYPAFIDITLNNGTVIKVENEMNEYGLNSGFAGSYAAGGAQHKVGAYYTDLSENKKVSFHVTVDGKDVYCEEAKYVYSISQLDLYVLMITLAKTMIRGGFSSPADTLEAMNAVTAEYKAYHSLVVSNKYLSVYILKDLLKFNLNYDIRNIKNIITGDFLKSLFK